MGWLKGIFGTEGQASLEDLIKRAEAGDVKSQFHLGTMYQDGVQAARWYRRAAESGDAEAPI